MTVPKAVPQGLGIVWTRGALNPMPLPLLLFQFLHGCGGIHGCDDRPHGYRALLALEDDVRFVYPVGSPMSATLDAAGILWTEHGSGAIKREGLFAGTIDGILEDMVTVDGNAVALAA